MAHPASSSGTLLVVKMETQSKPCSASHQHEVEQSEGQWRAQTRGGAGERPSSMETERECWCRGTSMSYKLCQSGLDAERTGKQRWDVAVEGTQASRASILPTSIWESKEDARKAAGAWSEALHRLKTTSTAGEGTSQSEAPPGWAPKASLMVQSTFQQAWLMWEGGQVRMT